MTARIPRHGTRGFDWVFRSHVEGQAAWLMHQGGIRRATLYINRVEPCDICMARLSRALPEGYKLRVIGQSGEGFIFTGLPG